MILVGGLAGFGRASCGDRRRTAWGLSNLLSGRCDPSKGVRQHRGSIVGGPSFGSVRLVERTEYNREPCDDVVRGEIEDAAAMVRGVGGVDFGGGS